jgi:hypothetical protein
MKKDNPTPALPLTGEGAKEQAFLLASCEIEDNACLGLPVTEIEDNACFDLPVAEVEDNAGLAPPPVKGKAGRGLEFTRSAGTTIVLLCVGSPIAGVVIIQRF